MKTLIINGSPNGKKGNTEILSREFIKGMKIQPEIRYAVEENASALAAYMQGYDNWLFFFPLYVNAMPGIVKRLFEELPSTPEKGAGYFVQSGFEEAMQSDYLVTILNNFNIRMGYRDLGIVVSGGMAGVRYMPAKMNRKTFEHMQRAGTLYELAGIFADESKKHFGQLYRYSERQAKRYQQMRKLGLTDIMWNHMLRKNKAYQKRFDKPFGI
jgi:multimeric flavodoxin WrbA